MCGVSGMPSVQFNIDHVDGGFAAGASSFSRHGSPTLLELRDSVVRDDVTLILGQSFFQTAYDLSGAPECESYRVPKDFSLGHAPYPLVMPHKNI